MPELKFDLGPSDEYVRRRQAFEAAQTEYLTKNTTETSDEERDRLSKKMLEAQAALHEMAEHQDIEQLAKDTTDTYLGNLDIELATRGRMVAVMSVETSDVRPYRSIDVAITGCCGGSRVVDPLPGETDMLLSVTADMRRLDAGQVMRILRMMADRIEAEGVVIYDGQNPHYPRHRDPVWRVRQHINGTLHHEPAEPDYRPLDRPD